MTPDQQRALAVARARRRRVEAEAASVGPSPSAPVAGAVPAPPLSGMGPGGSDIPWWEQPPVPEAPPDDPLRGLKIGTQGVGAGLVELAGSPVDITAALLNAGSNLGTGAANLFRDEPMQAPQITNPIGGSEWIKDQAVDIGRRFGIEPFAEEDMDTVERAAYNVNRLGSQAVASGAGLARAGMSQLAAGRPVSHINPVLRPYAAAADNAATAGGPIRSEIAGARALLNDAAAGAGSGLALTAVEYADNPWLDLLATLGGGIGGAALADFATAPVAAVQGAVRHGMSDPNIPPDPRTGYRPSRAMGDTARRFVQETAVDPRRAAENVEAKTQTYRAADMAVPDTLLMSDDEGLLALRRGAVNASDDSGPAAPAFARQNRRVAQSATEQVQSLDPGPADPTAPGRYAEQRLETQREIARRGVDKATGETQGIDMAQQRVGGELQAQRGTADAASEQLDDVVVDQTLVPRRTAKNEMFAAVDPEGTVRRDVAPMIERVQTIRAEVADLPETLQREILPEPLLRDLEGFARQDVVRNVDTGLVDDAGRPITRSVSENVGGEGEMTFRAMSKMRPYLAEAIQRARAAKQYALADNLKALRDEIGEEAARLAGEGGEAGVRAQQAVDFYKNEFAPYFAQGQGGKLRAALNADDKARTNTPPTATAARFIRTGAGSKEAAADLKRILEIAPDPQQGQQAVRQYLLDSASRAVGGDGKIRPDALRAWIANHDGVLSQFPEVRSEFQGLLRDVVNGRTKANEAARALEQARAGMKLTERETQRSALSLLVDADPVKAVEKVFASNNPTQAMRKIVDTVKRNDAAHKGWKKAVAEYLEQKVTKTNTAGTAEGARNTSLAELNNLFTKHEKVLSELYRPDEMNALRRAQMAVEDLARAGVQAGTGSPTVENLAQLMRYGEIGLKGFFGQLKGGGMFRTLKLAVQTIPGADANAKLARILNQMAFDPELAKHLLTAPVNDKQVVNWNKRLMKLLAVGEAAREANDDD